MNARILDLELYRVRRAYVRACRLLAASSRLLALAERLRPLT